MTRVISIINLKGGVGKTFTAANMAHILNFGHGKRVLLVDNDKQGNFSEVDTSGLKQPIICVYNHPADYPDKCVARIFDGVTPTDTVITRDTVEELREDISKRFPDKLPFAAGREDYKSVVESWI